MSLWSILGAILSPVGLASLWAAIHYRGKAAEWKAAWLEVRRQMDCDRGMVLQIQADAMKWRTAAKDAEVRARAAQQEAAEIQARFESLADKIRQAEIPADAEGALNSMAILAHQLAQEVGRG